MFLKKTLSLVHSGKTLILFVGSSSILLLAILYFQFIYPSEKLEKEILPKLQTFTQSFSECVEKPSSCSKWMCPITTQTQTNIDRFINALEESKKIYGKRLNCEVNPASILVQNIYSHKTDYNFQVYFQCKAKYQNPESSIAEVLENWLVLVRNLDSDNKLCLFSLKSK